MPARYATTCPAMLKTPNVIPNLLRTDNSLPRQSRILVLRSSTSRTRIPALVYFRAARASSQASVTPLAAPLASPNTGPSATPYPNPKSRPYVTALVRVRSGPCSPPRRSYARYSDPRTSSELPIMLTSASVCRSIIQPHQQDRLPVSQNEKRIRPGRLRGVGASVYRCPRRRVETYRGESRCWWRSRVFDAL